jgi:hypothetical protein
VVLVDVLKILMMRSKSCRDSAATFPLATLTAHPEPSPTAGGWPKAENERILISERTS